MRRNKYRSCKKTAFGVKRYAWTTGSRKPFARIEEYYRRFPGFRQQVEVTWCFDEIQVVSGWERFARRVLDSENVEMFLSGSSARMLSREVATSMRGRAMETVITPYSFHKLYLADHGLAQAFSPATGLDRGHLIENLVACELARRSRELAYVKTATGFEVDFLATDWAGGQELIQVASDLSSPATFAREIRALLDAQAESPAATALLLCESAPPKGLDAPETIRILPVWQWLLTEPPGETPTRRPKK